MQQKEIGPKKDRDMTPTASDIMKTTFRTLTPQTPIDQAVALFKKAAEEEDQKVFGMMVVDSEERLIGMISMYDILLFMRPKHIQIWGSMDDIDVVKILKLSRKKISSVYVGDLMTPDVISVTPQTHILMTLEIMIKKHIRRVPVLEDRKIMGMVYISDLFYELLDSLTN